MSDHDDIVQLIEAGDTDAARELLAQREAKGGVSGHDRQTLTVLLEKVAQPPPAEPERTPRRERRVEFDKGPDASGRKGVSHAGQR